jgi:ABC-type sugar transport system substrate-binding protein
MKNSSLITATAAIAALAAAALFTPITHAKDEPVAQNTTTVWVSGKGQSSFAGEVNKTHARMEAKGWKFGDLAIYIEDGDMQGAFVTYVR